MRLLFTRHLKLRHLGISVALVAIAAAIASITGVLASTTGLPLGTSTACGCAQFGAESEGVEVGPGKPLIFPRNVKSKKLILRNPGNRKQFTNGGFNIGTPGEFRTGQAANFGLKKIAANECLEILEGGGATCEMEITSAAGGNKTEYHLTFEPGGGEFNIPEVKSE